MGDSSHRLGGNRSQIGEMGTRLVPVDFLQCQDICVQSPDGSSESIKIDHPVLDRAAVQDVECRQPHGKKVPTIAEQMPPLPTTSDEPLLRAALKRSVSALKADGVPFALGGGYALWVHGGPEPSHDVDLVVAETDVELAANSLAAAGLLVDRPPEDWLFKAYFNNGGGSTEDAEEPALVDVLHRLGGTPVTAGLLETAREHEVLGIRIPVLPSTPIVIAKLLSLSEHYCDFAPLLLGVRAVREQLDWAEIRNATRDQPFAEAFLFLAERLGLVTPLD